MCKMEVGCNLKVCVIWPIGFGNRETRIALQSKRRQGNLRWKLNSEKEEAGLIESVVEHESVTY